MIDWKSIGFYTWGFRYKAKGDARSSGNPYEGRSAWLASPLYNLFFVDWEIPIRWMTGFSTVLVPLLFSASMQRFIDTPIMSQRGTIWSPTLLYRYLFSLFSMTEYLLLMIDWILDGYLSVLLLDHPQMKKPSRTHQPADLAFGCPLLAFRWLQNHFKTNDKVSADCSHRIPYMVHACYRYAFTHSVAVFLWLCSIGVERWLAIRALEAPMAEYGPLLA